MMARTTKNHAKAAFTKVSEWVAAGNMATGFYCLEQVERETDKALGFKAETYTEFGKIKPAICWMPKSKVQAVANDFYFNGPAKMFLVPAWLYSAKTDEGFVL
jgi:hypothetical protein